MLIISVLTWFLERNFVYLSLIITPFKMNFSQSNPACLKQELSNMCKSELIRNATNLKEFIIQTNFENNWQRRSALVRVFKFSRILYQKKFIVRK